MSVEADPRVSSEIAGYRIEALVDRGGMGVVYRAHDIALNRNVALKLISPDLAEDERSRERFLHESRVAASIDHANIVPIHDAGESRGQLYIAMRLVEGTDLGRCWSRRARSIRSERCGFWVRLRALWMRRMSVGWCTGM